MFGKIKWFKEEKGYGFIIGPDDEEYLFNINDSKDKLYQSGDIVKFIPNYEEINYATHIEKINN